MRLKNAIFMHNSIKREHLKGYVFIFPALALLFALVGYPLIYNLVSSFFRSSFGAYDFVGFRNYKDAFTSPGFTDVIVNSLIWTFGNMAVMMLLGFLSAVALDRELHGKTVIQVVLLIPWVVPFVVSGVTWMFLYHPRWGVVNDILIRLGLMTERIAWLSEPNLALGSVMIAYIWKVYPYVMILLLAGLKSIPETLYDAAEIDGANGLMKLWHVTIPQLSGIIRTVVLIVGIWTFNSFDVIYVMTGGGPIYTTETIAMRIYKFGFKEFRLEVASATAVIASIILVLCSILYLRERKED